MVESGFYDLHICPDPRGRDKVEELAATAKHLGYSGIAITNPDSSKALCPLPKLSGIELLSAVEIMVKNASKLHSIVERYRDKVDIITVCGGIEGVNRAAVENPKVDLLTHMNIGQDSGFNHVLAKAASENRVAISFDLDDIIRLRGGSRVHALSNFRKNLQLIRKYDVPFLLTSGAGSCYDMRAPRELMALASLFGMSREEAISGLIAIPEMLISRNRPPEGYLYEGVEVIGTEIMGEEFDGDDIE